MKKVINVAPLENHTLALRFEGGEMRLFDVKPYLDFGIFRELKDISYFNSVRIMFDSIAWENGQDFSPQTLYLKSIPLELNTNTNQHSQSNSSYI